MLVNSMIQEIEKKPVYNQCFCQWIYSDSCELKRGSYMISFVTCVMMFLVNK